MTQILRHAPFYLLSITIRWTPRPIMNGLSSGIAALWYYVLRFRRDLVFRNLHHAYRHEKSEKEIRTLVYENLRHYVVLALEFMSLSSLSTERLLENVELQNVDHIWNALRQKKGVIFLTAHMGNFEMMVARALYTGFTVHIVARAMKNKWIDSWLMNLRTRRGVSVIQPKDAKWQVLRRLKKNQIIGFMLDQRKSPPDGIFVNFFGRPAATTQGLAYLVERTGAVVVPVFNYRTDFGKLVIRVEEPVEYKRVGTRKENIYYNTQAFSDVVEKVIRKHPEQWFWIHRRWKGSHAYETQSSA